MRLRLKARTTWRATSANCIFFESISVCSRRPCENAPHARAVEWRSHQTSHKACGSRCSLRCKCFVRSACQIGGVQARHLDRLAHAADSVSLSDACSSNHRGVPSVLANASDPWSPCFVSLPPKSNCKKKRTSRFSTDRVIQKCSQALSTKETSENICEQATSIGNAANVYFFYTLRKPPISPLFFSTDADREGGTIATRQKTKSLRIPLRLHPHTRGATPACATRFIDVDVISQNGVSNSGAHRQAVLFIRLLLRRRLSIPPNPATSKTSTKPTAPVQVSANDALPTTFSSW